MTGRGRKEHGALSGRELRDRKVQVLLLLLDLVKLGRLAVLLSRALLWVRGRCERGR